MYNEVLRISILCKGQTKYDRIRPYNLYSRIKHETTSIIRLMYAILPERKIRY